MTIRIEIDFDCPRWLRRSVTTIGVPLLVLGASTTVLADVSVPHTFMSGQVVSSQQMNANFQALRDGINSAVPVGTIVAYGGPTAPDGWLLCDGSERNQSAYPKLFAAINTSFGVGTGTGGSFNLPDLRGRFLRGVSTDPTRDPGVNERMATNGGNAKGAVGSLQDDALQGHSHLDSGHSHGTQQYVAFSGTQVANYQPGTYGLLGGSGTQDGHAKLGDPTNSNSGGGAPRVTSETRPRNVYVNYIIKY